MKAVTSIRISAALLALLLARCGGPSTPTAAPPRASTADAGTAMLAPTADAGSARSPSQDAGAERHASTNPPPPNPCPEPGTAPMPGGRRCARVLPQQKCALVLDGRIEFEIAKAIIKRESFPLLDRVVATLASHPEWKIQIEGHQDRENSYAAIPLSTRRAKAVREYLVRRGIALERLTARGFGEDRPIADNRTREGRLKNRRIEFVIENCEASPR